MPSVDPPPLNPAQQQALDQLGAVSGERPTFPEDLRARLRHDLEAGLAPILAELGPDDDLTVSKHLLSLVHGCEGRMLAEEAEGNTFVVSVPIARGTVAHKAIELGIHWRGDAAPLDLVDEALARLTNTDHWLADWLQACPEADRAELRATAGDRVHKFFECFPPLQPRWRPVTESSLWVDLLGGRVRLKGKVDLTIGQARGHEAGKVIIDLKTGGPSGTHRDDLRFYALLEAVRIGVPPRLVASYYLDLGEARSEPVTEGILDATVARTVDGARRVVDLRNGSVAPTLRPSYACRWCPALATCETGRDHLRATDDLDDLQEPVDA
ncbi:MAG TPA: PD-(D/E)XK nuclease family protein [Acidimicrobiales bacterium]